MFDKQKVIGSNPIGCSSISLKVEYGFCKPCDVGSSPTWSISKCRWQNGYALDCKSMGFPMEVRVLSDTELTFFKAMKVQI